MSLILLLYIKYRLNRRTLKSYDLIEIIIVDIHSDMCDLFEIYKSTKYISCGFCVQARINIPAPWCAQNYYCISLCLIINALLTIHREINFTPVST